MLAALIASPSASKGAGHHGQGAANSQSAVDYPGRPTQVSGRVVRGGSWRESAWFNAIGIRSAENHRHGARSDVGFRVAIQPE